MRKQLTPDEQTWANMRSSLRMYKSKCASLERKVARLQADHPCVEHEREIAMLEERITALLHCVEQAELEVLQLKRELQRRSAA